MKPFSFCSCLIRSSSLFRVVKVYFLFCNLFGTGEQGVCGAPSGRLGNGRQVKTADRRRGVNVGRTYSRAYVMCLEGICRDWVYCDQCLCMLARELGAIRKAAKPVGKLLILFIAVSTLTYDYHLIV